jgi:hypothetical protein
MIIKTYYARIQSIALILLLISCESNDKTANTSKPTTLSSTVGAQIPNDVADRWMAAYQQKSTSGRTGDVNKVTASQLTDLLATVPGAIGIAFHYAIDDDGEQHILAIGLDHQSQMWSTDQNRIAIDASTGMVINEATAYTWTEAFKAAHQDDVWYYFFGSHVFEEMKEISWFREFNLERGVNDEGVLQLLLILENSQTNGRVNDDTRIVYDKGGPCPPCEYI